MLFDHLIEVHDPDPHSAAMNMALDEALLRHATEPTLRIYRWSRRALSLGYFSRFAEAQLVATGRELVRRWTGGGLVEHGDDLTYTLIVPQDAPFLRHSPLESYRLIHEQIALHLRAHGVAAEVAAHSSAQSSSACFAGHVQYDIVVGTAKLAGAAQRRTRWGLLHQGSVQATPGLAGIAEELPRAFASKVTRQDLPPEVHTDASKLAESRYGTAAWLQRF